MMNCDQVFDVLTRGPFPTGHRSDRAVESHLEVCPECQRLANALRPAVELFQEAITGDEGRELPGYWGGIEELEETSSQRPLAQVARRLPVALHQRLDRGRRWIKGRTGNGNAVRFAAAILVGVGLAGLVWTAGIPARKAAEAGTNLAAAPLPVELTAHDLAWNAAAGTQLPVANEARISLELSAACLTGSDLEHNPPGGVSAPDAQAWHSPALSLAELSRLNCCTRCHHAQATQVPMLATAAVTRSCEFCHR